MTELEKLRSLVALYEDALWKYNAIGAYDEKTDGFTDFAAHEALEKGKELKG